MINPYGFVEVSLMGSGFEPTEADFKRWRDKRESRKRQAEIAKRGAPERIRQAEEKRTRKALKLIRKGARP